MIRAIPDERRLAALAAALIADTAALAPAERALVTRVDHVDTGLVADIRAQIRAGHDPLGGAFCALRSAEQRRGRGATYTPAPIIDAMVAWAADERVAPARVIDPGVGSGRFLLAAAEKFPYAQLLGVDIDPLATLMLRANAAVRGFAPRLTVALADYRKLELPAIAGATLFIGNPPYVRHHDIDERWKAWFAATASRHGHAASKLAGLHIHFFLKTRELARSGDFGSFITAAEWLDVNYGSLVRNMLMDGLGGAAIHIIDPRARPFADALATGAVTCFRVGNRPASLTMRSVAALDELAPLGRGTSVAWNDVAGARKWSALIRNEPPMPRGLAASGMIELGQLFRVHRGQVTGSNAIWIESDAARDVPPRFKRIAVTSARELTRAGGELVSADGLQRVVDLPADLDELSAEEMRAVRRFLAWARRRGAHETYTARHRPAWWSVGLHAPAPVLCTYMARRPPAFVRNRIAACHLNIAHGLYPVEPLSETALADILAWLRDHVGSGGGRVYAGGLVKFEPKEIERILVPRPR
ncbi:MAG TPA: N-6 DNA methylase [Xanthobacteraceae bacterium]|nr:N-6 DNA methylase [Xanthobacteraceae bacterium]